MQALAQQHSAYRRQFDALDRTAEPAWLAQRREQAIERFERLGFPTKRIEAWRNINLAAFGQHEFVPAPAPAGAAAASGLELDRAHRLAFVDGHYNAEASSPGELPAGVTVLTLREALAAEHPALTEHLGRQLSAEHAFAALNEALWQDGVLLHLQPGTVLDMPLLLDFARSARADRAAYPRVLVVAESGAQAQLIEHYRGPADTAYLSCPVTELVLAANAGIEWYKLQEEGAGAFHFGSIVAELERDARFKAHSLASGGKLARTELYVNLNGPGADAQLDGLYLTGEGQYSDHHSWMEHRAGHCSSRQRFKGVLDGKSEAVYDGLVRVAHGAAKTDAQQENRNLLLSKRALAHSNPRLEIYTDDVKCSHGSTVGELDRDALFYLRSRGIGHDDARALLTYAFAAELLTAIGIDGLRDYEQRALFALLPGDATVREVL